MLVPTRKSSVAALKPHSALAGRLSRYLGVALRLVEDGHDFISSYELGHDAGVYPSQVRQDLRGIELRGTRGVGYRTGEMIEAAREVLGLRENRDLVLVGIGKLGSAIAESNLLPEMGFAVRRAFDNDPRKLGRTVGNVVVEHVGELEKGIPEDSETVGVIATPGSAARETTELLVRAGVRVIIDYADASLSVPEGVEVYRPDPLSQLSHTLYYATNKGRRPERPAPLKSRASSASVRVSNGSPF